MLRSSAPTDSTNSIFENESVAKSIFSMVAPTIISQIILVIYNLADTWYVGRTGNANAVAAISLCLPVYTILSAISNLFGIGGASVIARALGNGTREKARRAFAVAAYGALLSSLLFSVLVFCFCRPLLLLIGGDSGDLEYATDYLCFTTVIGGIPTVLAPAFAHMIRAYGNPKAAGFGMILGALLNLALDPLLMFVLLQPGHEVQGAAIATMISNFVSFAYFLIYLFLNRKAALFTFCPARGSLSCDTLREILSSGLPSFCMQALAMFSNCFLNSMLSAMGSEAVAGIGIVRKIDQLAFAVNQGISQGMLPLVAYCYSSRNYRRMKRIILYCAAATFSFSFVCMCVSLLFAPQLVGFFLSVASTVRYGSEFLRVICLCIPVYSLTFIIITVFQAVGRGTEPLLLSFLHKGTLDIALMFLIRSVLSPSYITIAAPISDAVALCIGAILLYRLLKNFSGKKKDPPSADSPQKGDLLIL